jgi:hypothetical protein
MENEKIYICPPDWWPVPVPQGHALLLMKSMYGTRQAARRWHQRISGWMESHDCQQRKISVYEMGRIRHHHAWTVC